jgi:hypothetical protein
MGRIKWIAVVLLIAAPAAAQQTTSTAGLRTEGLATVFVQDDNGGETKGKLLRLDQQSVMLLVDGQEQTFELSGVRRIQKRGDSLKNGAIAGAVFGAVMGIMIGGFSDCPSVAYQCTAGARTVIALTSTAIYSAIGAGVDAAIPGRTTLYQRPLTTGLASASGPGAAVRFKVSW